MILISPFARPLRSEGINPKNYPFWKELIQLIDEPIIQVGRTGEEKLVPDCRFDLSLVDLRILINECKTWISIDSFFQHYCWDIGVPGIVLWGQSDPLIFGHPENTNLLKDRSFLRQNQFWLWEQCDYRTDCFVSPEEVLRYL